jgi:hypothetical protein
MLIQNIFRSAVAIAFLAMLSMPNTSAVPVGSTAKSQFESLEVPSTKSTTKSTFNSLTVPSTTAAVTTAKKVSPTTATKSTRKTSKTNGSSATRRYYIIKNGKRQYVQVKTYRQIKPLSAKTTKAKTTSSSPNTLTGGISSYSYSILPPPKK